MDAKESNSPKASPIELPQTSTMDSTQKCKKRNLSDQSLLEEDDRKKIFKESTSPRIVHKSDCQEVTVGHFSIIDVSGSSDDVSLHGLLHSDSSMKSKSLADEMNEVWTRNCPDTDSGAQIETTHKDPIYVRMSQVRNNALASSSTSTPVSQSRTLLSSFVKNLKRLTYDEIREDFTDVNVNKSLAENTSITQENNLCLKNITKVLEGVDKTVTNMSERLDQLELHVDKSIKRIDKRLDENGRLIEVLADEIVAKTDDMKLYVDGRITDVTKGLPTMLATMGKDVDAKISQTSNTLLQTLEDRVSNLVSTERAQEICTNRVNVMVAERKLVGQVEIDSLIRRVESLERILADKSEKHHSASDLDTLKEQVSDVIRNNERSYHEISEKFTDVHSKLDGIMSEDQFSQKAGIDWPLWHDFKHRTEEMLFKFPKMEYRLNEMGRQISVHDMKHRKLNILVEHLVESENENTLDRVNAIFDIVLNDAERKIAQVSKAYRLGRKNAGNVPRKILLEMKSSDGKDIVLANARRISKAGNDGRAYYINEDLPESHKRWRSDIHKYINFMTKKKHEVEWRGDELLIDGVRWKINDLDAMPPGERLMDSRTIFHRGVVAFQSHLSPLSNLFPCRIRHNGITFASLEHAYQHNKAIFHGKTDIAEDILGDDDPYVAMSHGKRITRESQAWTNKKLEVMTGLLRQKADQCSVFHNTLKSTYGHTLVENSWNSFWGSACPFVCEAVWMLQFKGANNLGKLLEKLREEI